MMTAAFTRPALALIFAFAAFIAAKALAQNLGDCNPITVENQDSPKCMNASLCGSTLPMYAGDGNCFPYSFDCSNGHS